MNRPMPAVLGFGLALAAGLVPPAAAPQSGKPPRGARIAVMAYHDSRLFTLCPVYGKDVIESNLWTSRMKAKVTVFHPPTGGQSIGLHFDVERQARVMLPLPAAAGQDDLDRLARDVGVEQRLAGEFRARKVYSVVDSPGDADFVFVAESTYIAMSAGTADPPAPRVRPAGGGRDSPARIFSDTEDEWNRRYNWRESMRNPPALPPPASRAPLPPLPTFVGVIGGDRHLNWRQAILGVLVPASAYRQHAGDGAALAAASVWNGVAAEERERRTDGSASIGAASPESLAGHFHAEDSGLPVYLPVCGASVGVLRSIHDGPDTAPPPPAEAAAAQPLAIPQRDPGRPRFTSGITLVAVPLTVTGRDGQPIRDLPVSAFHVFEDEVEQKVERLDPGSVPADVALLVDTSASMREVRDLVRSSASSFTAALRAADRAMIVSLDKRVRVLAEFTRDREALERAFARIGPGGGTRLYDALALVAVDRMDQVEGRKAAILLTDGVDTQSQLTDEAGALAAIEASNTPVFVVRFETADAGSFLPAGAYGVKRWLIPPDGPERIEAARALADRFLMRLTSGSGGRLLAARPDAGVPEMLARIGDELSSQLILGYYPSNAAPDGTYRRIRVTADCEGCSVRARTGYRAGVMR